MQYVGGKQKSGGHTIAATVQRYASGPGKIIEPFCGGLSVTYRLLGQRYASDACVPLITLYRAILEGWEPPAIVTREEWDACRKNPDPEDPMTAFIGFGCSRSGAWFSSFIEDYKYTKRRVPAATAARNSLMRKLEHCEYVSFASHDYTDAPTNGVIYCDIPYLDSIGYPAVGPFDHERFWSWAESISEKTPVLVSERVAPESFLAIHEWSIQRRLNTQTNTRRVERLFVHERWT